jgi:hypothetical protein
LGGILDGGFWILDCGWGRRSEGRGLRCFGFSVFRRESLTAKEDKDAKEELNFELWIMNEDGVSGRKEVHKS